MESLSVADAARRLSISDVAVYKALGRGDLQRVPGSGPARVTLASVQLLAHQRRSEALRRRADLAAFARAVDGLLHPLMTSTPLGAKGSGFYLLPTGRAALKVLPDDARAIFGTDTLEAAASRDQLRRGGGCPTCWAHMASRVHGTRPPEDSPAWQILLGEPCAADRARWAAEAAERRRTADHQRQADTARQAQAERDRARAEFSAAHAAAETAAQRVRSAARHLATLDPQIAREATAQARRRGAFKAASRFPDWCTCTADRQCTRHAAADRRAARR